MSQSLTPKLETQSSMSSQSSLTPSSTLVTEVSQSDKKRSLIEIIRELDELEQVWDLSWQQQEMVERHSPTGSNSEQILFHDDESEKCDHYEQSAHAPRKEFGNSSVNMELFYGSSQ